MINYLRKGVPASLLEWFYINCCLITVIILRQNFDGKIVSVILTALINILAISIFYLLVRGLTINWSKAWQALSWLNIGALLVIINMLNRFLWHKYI